MVSPFTFSMSVPGIINPFSKSPDLPGNTSALGTADTALRDQVNPSFTGLHRPHPSSLPPPIPLSRKRGWQPSHPEPSPPTTVTMSTTAYRDTHPNCSDSTATSEAMEHERQTPDLPPAKRRRTLAGTIVYGALNAALIGTAVGITVYRLWRDRDKFSESQPPPYEEGDWAPPSQPERVSPSGPIAVPAHRNKNHRTPHNNTSRGTPRHRRTRTQAKLPVSPRPSRQHSLHRHTKSEGEEEDEGDGLDDKMDWMGDRLAQLVEDGKKALRKEVVVISETIEDEEDDGNGNWEEDVDPSLSNYHASGSSTLRHRGRQAPATASYTSPFLSPPSSAPSHPQQFLAAHSYYSSPSLPIPGCTSQNDAVDMARSYSSYHEDESQWQSSELRESMERARAAYLRNRP